MQLLLNALVFIVWLPKEENEGGEGRIKRECQLIKSPESHVSQCEERLAIMKGGGATMAGHSMSAFYDQKQQSDPDVQYLEDRVLNAHPGSCKLFQDHMHSCLPWARE